MRTKTNLSISIILVAGLVFAGCEKSLDQPVQTVENLAPVRVQTVKLDDMENTLEYVGTLKPAAQIKIFSPVMERVLEFSWEDGDEIEAGKQVARIRSKSLKMGLAQADAQIEALSLQIENQKADLGRAKGLLNGKVISQQAYDQADTAYRANLAQRKSMRAGRGQMAVTARDAIVKAPIDGVIANKSVEVGDTASPQAPICTIMKLDTLIVNLKLSEADVPKVNEGQVVSFKLDAYPDRTFNGAITKILPYLNEGTRTNTVEVTIPNPVDPTANRRLLKPGMFGRATLSVGKLSKVPVIPEVATIIEEDEGGETQRKAFVVDSDGIAHERTVRVGARKGNLIAVLEGVAANEKIVTRGQYGLLEGQAVSLVGETGEIAQVVQALEVIR